MNAILSTDQLRSTVPSAFDIAPWKNLSSNYRFVPTIEVLGMMQDQGFFPVVAKQSRTRIEGKVPFTKHLIRIDFTHASLRPARAAARGFIAVGRVGKLDG